MVTYDQATNTYTLEAGETNFTLATDAGDAHVVGNDLDNAIVGNAGDNLLEGGQGSDTLQGGLGADTLRGGAGNDTYYIFEDGDVIEGEAADGGTDEIVSDQSVDLTLAAQPALAFIENITLGGNLDISAIGNALANHIVGNSGANTLMGGDGNDALEGGDGADTLDGGNHDDFLDGGLGNDSLVGGDGNDTYVIDGAGDVIVEEAGKGNDTVIVGYAASSYSLVGTSIENLVLSFAGEAIGNEADNKLTGSNGGDRLVGGEGHDTLVGGEGADILVGGNGNDSYYVDSQNDIVTEQAGEGTDDRIYASISLALASYANVEHLTLTGTANINGTGSETANELVGNGGNNTLDGLGGNDTIKGGGGSDVLKGGAGIDDLWGEAGDDTYMVDGDGDVLHESAGEGTDTVQSSVNYTLADNFENLTLTGSASSGTGNGAANFIRGNAGANTLIGLGGDDSLMGGAGADRMDGGAGSDLYWIDDVGDVVVEGPSLGFDRVLASVSYTLGANVEYLAFEGSGNLVGKGNELDNYLFGNVGANTLDGGAGRDQIDGGEGNDRLLGGAGDDTINDWRGNDVIDGGAGRDDLRGGVGNDTYYVDSLDLVTELAGQGADTVIASSSFALGKAAEVEALLAKSGTARINLTGSDTANRITGNAGTNVIAGKDGNDILTGGRGKDRFVFNTKADAKLNMDKILDFRAVDDTIALENAIFTKLGKKTGTLKASMFYIGKKAHDKDDRIIYDKGTGALYYDADGTGKTKAVKFATVKKGIFLDYHDFLVI